MDFLSEPYTMPINPSELLSTNLIKLSSESDEKCLEIICCCPLFKWQNNCPPTFRLTEHVKAGQLGQWREIARVNCIRNSPHPANMMQICAEKLPKMPKFATTAKT